MEPPAVPYWDLYMVAEENGVDCSEVALSWLANVFKIVSFREEATQYIVEVPMVGVKGRKTIEMRVWK